MSKTSILYDSNSSIHTSLYKGVQKKKYNLNFSLKEFSRAN